MKKLIDLAAKVPPLVAVFLLLLALVPLFIFFFSLIRKKNQVASLQHEVNVLNEEANHAAAVRIFELNEDKRKELDDKITFIAEQVAQKDQELQDLEQERKSFQDKLSSITSWEDLK